MNLHITQNDDMLSGRLSGRLDNAAFAKASSDMKILAENADKQIILDCSGLQFISLAAMQFLHQLHEATLLRGGRMSIRNMAVKLMQMFSAAGLTSLLNFE